MHDVWGLLPCGWMLGQYRNTYPQRETGAWKILNVQLKLP
jgi:hypothetical protein